MAQQIQVSLRVLLGPTGEGGTRARRLLGAVAETLQFPRREQIELEQAAGELLSLIHEHAAPSDDVVRLSVRGTPGRVSLTVSWASEAVPDFTASANPLAAAHENRNHVIQNSVTRWRSFRRSGRHFVTLEKQTSPAALFPA